MDSFYTLRVDKNKNFLTPSPPYLVHVVIEWPLSLVFANIGHNFLYTKLWLANQTLQFCHMTTLDYLQIQQKLQAYEENLAIL